MKRKLCYMDTETVGLVGPAVLIQTQFCGEDVSLHHVFKEKARATLTLIERIMDEGYVAFNAAYDHYHLQRLYCLLLAAGRPQAVPTGARLREVERRAVFGPCLRPRHILDLDIVLRMGPYQQFMNRDPVIVYNVPDELLAEVQSYLNDRIPRAIDPFHWHAKPEQNVFKVSDKSEKPGFHTIKLSMHPKLTLKAIHEHIFGDPRPGLPIPPEIMPKDKQGNMRWTWLPYGEEATVNGVTREGIWPEYLAEHVKFWAETDSTYAADDIHMLREIDEHLGYPEADDYNSVLTACVASVRYRGYPFDRAGARRLYENARQTVTTIETRLGANLNQHAVIKDLLLSACVEELEQSAIPGSSDKVLKQLVTWTLDDGSPHPVAEIARDVRRGRTADKRVTLFEKLLTVGRFHPSFRVFGTGTDRMSGADGVNPQGIDKDFEVRSLFHLVDTPDDVANYLREYDPYWASTRRSRWYREVLRDLREDPFVLSGGDFDGFETAITIAVWADETMDRLVRRGTKAYVVFGSHLYRDRITAALQERYQKALVKRGMNPLQAYRKMQSYEPDVRAWLSRADADKVDDPKHFGEEKKRSKNCWYGMLYGAQEQKLSETSGITVEEVKAGIKAMEAEVPGMKEARAQIQNAFRAIHLGEGGKWTWADPEAGIENMHGFERQFVHMIPLIRALWEASAGLPREWDELEGEVVRSEKRGPQKIASAVRSAIFGAALSLQGRVMRQASNFVMQAVGATINKQVQSRMWLDLQPVGVAPWVVQPMNVHDEDLAAHRARVSCSPSLNTIVDLYKTKIPLIKIEWKENIRSWAEK